MRHDQILVFLIVLEFLIDTEKSGLHPEYVGTSLRVSLLALMGLQVRFMFSEVHSNCIVETGVAG